MTSGYETKTSELNNKMPENEITNAFEGNETGEHHDKKIDMPDLNLIERMSFSALLEQNRISGFQNVSELSKTAPEKEQKNLTDEQKKKIKEETNWSDEIINAIGSWEEYKIYKNAGLQEAEINGKKCLIRSDIDMNQKDADGITNAERMKRGLPPITKEGKAVELHHIGQHEDSPLAELTTDEHWGVGNDAILHNKTKESEIDRNQFANERKEHWKARSNEQ